MVCLRPSTALLGSLFVGLLSSSAALAAPSGLSSDAGAGVELMAGRDTFVAARNNNPVYEDLNERIVYNPSITYPKAGVTWTAGEEGRVEWKTAGIPDELKDSTVSIRLGHEEADGKGGENLANTLAKGVKLSKGKAKFDVPKDLETRNDYIVVLFGDSGNASDKFTINGSS